MTTDILTVKWWHGFYDFLASREDSQCASAGGLAGAATLCTSETRGVATAKATVIARKARRNNAWGHAGWLETDSTAREAGDCD